MLILHAVAVTASFNMWAPIPDYLVIALLTTWVFRSFVDNFADTTPTTCGALCDTVQAS